MLEAHAMQQQRASQRAFRGAPAQTVRGQRREYPRQGEVVPAAAAQQPQGQQRHDHNADQDADRGPTGDARDAGAARAWRSIRRPPICKTGSMPARALPVPGLRVIRTSCTHRSGPMLM